MTDKSIASTELIFNGAQCKTYSWSQSHTDLEINVSLRGSIKREDIRVTLTNDEICIELLPSATSVSQTIPPGQPVNILVEGKFEHPVDTESAYWLVEKGKSNLVVYIDKREDRWWKQLLINEKVTTTGPKNYSIPMEHLDEGARMSIQKLIKEQREKRVADGDDDEFSLA